MIAVLQRPRESTAKNVTKMRIYAGMRSVIVLAGAALAVACAAAGTVTFTEETGVFRNPGQGWSTMGGKWSFDKTDPVVNVGSVYCRYAWSQLEPEEGRYNWKPLEDLFDFAASKGLPASFRVMCASRHDNTGWTTPPWVFKKGAKDDPFLASGTVRGKETNIVHHTPIFDDPVFMDAHRRFIKALAARYDGDPRLAGLDLGSYGHWGEWHCGGLPPNTNLYVAAEVRAKLKRMPPREYPFEIRKQYADWYLEGFKNTPIVFMTGDWEVLKYALGTEPTARVGLRRDGVGSPWHFKRWIGTKPYDAIPRMGDVWKDRPVWFEFYGDAQSILEKKWDLPYAIEWMLTNHVTVVNTCPFSPWQLKDDPVHYPLLRKIDLYAGVRLVPLTANVRREGNRLSVELSGVNKGVARMHLPYVAQIVVTDAAGSELMVHEAAVDPGSWLPGPFRLVDAFDLPPESQDGLKLALRLRHRYGFFRNFRFAARETLPDGSLPLGPVR